MRNIKEAEKVTGITKQNIRYYEKQGLITPNRNLENDYREYGEKEIERLKLIKLFRKLDMPIEEIRKIFDHETELSEAIEEQKKRLTSERKRLSDAIDFCDRINEKKLEEIDVNEYLDKIEQEEKKGAVFADWLNDFKKVHKAEEKREFHFMPDTMCKTKREFTEALCKYANENNLNLVITKESMYPEFTIDGIPYVADRYFCRFGAVVRCQMINKEDYLPQEVSEKRYKAIKIVLERLIPIFIVVGLWIIYLLVCG